jgi:hypothetical protein
MFRSKHTLKKFRAGVLLDYADKVHDCVPSSRFLQCALYMLDEMCWHR